MLAVAPVFKLRPIEVQLGFAYVVVSVHSFAKNGRTNMDLITRFKGEWVLNRHIFDLDSQWLGKFEGVAIMTPSENALHYHEEGKLQFGGLTAMTATRDYTWIFPGKDMVRVMFDDGRHFHDFDATEKRPQATHYCDPDEYDVTYLRKHDFPHRPFLLCNAV